MCISITLVSLCIYMYIHMHIEKFLSNDSHLAVSVKLAQSNPNHPLLHNVMAMVDREPVCHATLLLFSLTFGGTCATLCPLIPTSACNCILIVN